MDNDSLFQKRSKKTYKAASERRQEKKEKHKDKILLPEVNGIVKGCRKPGYFSKKSRNSVHRRFRNNIAGLYGQHQNSWVKTCKVCNPGLDFILGYQPDTNWINKFGAKGLLSRDPLFNALIQQRYNQRLNITAQVITFRDLNIDINLDKTFAKNILNCIRILR